MEKRHGNVFGRIWRSLIWIFDGQFDYTLVTPPERSVLKRIRFNRKRIKNDYEQGICERR